MALAFPYAALRRADEVGASMLFGIVSIVLATGRTRRLPLMERQLCRRSGR